MRLHRIARALVSVAAIIGFCAAVLFALLHVQDPTEDETVEAQGPPPSVETTTSTTSTTSTTTPPPPPLAPDCSTWANQAEAQAWVDENWAFHDISNIDTDGDDRPCTAHFAPPTTESRSPKVTDQTVIDQPDPPEPVYSAGGSVWDELAQCEAGGNWAHANGDNFDGGLQFHTQTWISYGGLEFADRAYNATREQQIIVAERILASHGGTYRAWPGCRAKLGLP